VTDRPQPVLTAAGAAGVILLLLHAVADRWLDPVVDEATWGVVRSVLDVLVPAVAAWWASRRVTPLSAPRDNLGRDLKPVPPDEGTTFHPSSPRPKDRPFG